MARRFRIIAHTADIGLVTRGGSLSEAFANAAYGMFSIMTDMRRVRLLEARSIEISEKDYESLLFEWLNQFLYLFDVQSMLFRRFEITEFSPQRLTARCSGEQFDPSRHHIKLGIKSATYHRLKVDPERNEVSVILDI